MRMSDKFDFGKTQEERFLALIDYIDANPYTLTVRKAANRFHLMEENVERLWELLALELIGKRDKNKRLHLAKFMEYNPKLTAEEIMGKTDNTTFIVYSVASEIGYRFENAYTKKSYNRKKSKNKLLTIQ